MEFLDPVGQGHPDEADDTSNLKGEIDGAQKFSLFTAQHFFDFVLCYAVSWYVDGIHVSSP